jgi:hypothetical protein
MFLSSSSFIKESIIRVLLNITGKSLLFKNKASFSLLGLPHRSKRHQGLKIKTSGQQGLKNKTSGFKKVFKTAAVLRPSHTNFFTV